MTSDKEVKAWVEHMAQNGAWKWNTETACVLAGIWNLYEAEGGSAYRDAVCKAMDQLAAEVTGDGFAGADLELLGCGRFLVPLYREYGKESYQAAAKLLWSRLQEQSWLDGARADWAEKFYLAEPFYLEYENQFHAKERYHQIQDQLKTAALLAVKLFDNQDEAAAGWYLSAMADCCGLISEEVFDHYKNAEGYLKAGLKLASGMKSLPVLYAVLKGCRIRALLSEKYLDQAVKLLKEAQDGMKQAKPQERGFLLMACGEYKKICLEGEIQ